MMNLYYEYNKGTNDITVVFLHGWGQNSRCFNKIKNKISEEFSTILFDLYGFGKSSEPENYYDTYEYAYHIFLTLSRLNLKKIILVGHSFGGRLTILLSSIFNLKVCGIVLASSAGVNRFELSRWLKIKTYKLCKKLVNLKLLKNFVLEKFGSADFKNASNVLKTILTRVVNQDLYDFTKLISCKTLLVWDKKDTSTKYFICKKLHKAITNSKVVLYKTGGHFTAFYNTEKFSNEINNLCQLVRDL